MNLDQHFFELRKVVAQIKDCRLPEVDEQTMELAEKVVRLYSKDLTIEELEAWAGRLARDVAGAGD